MQNSPISDDEALWAIRLQVQARLAEVIGEAEMIRQIEALLLASGRAGYAQGLLHPDPDLEPEARRLPMKRPSAPSDVE